MTIPHPPCGHDVHTPCPPECRDAKEQWRRETAQAISELQQCPHGCSERPCWHDEDDGRLAPDPDGQYDSGAASNGIIEMDSERGKELGFTSERFSLGSYLWDTPGRVTVSFIASRARGNFRGLVERILAEGKEVAVPTPLSAMASIVRRNGYVRTFEEHEMGGEVEVWILKPRAESDRAQ